MEPSRYSELFLSESRDNIATVNEALRELEQHPDASSAVDSVFRAVHTLKGMAGVMGYGPVVELAHAMESLLAGVRDGARSLAPDETALLFEAADALEGAIERSVIGEGTGTDHASLCERLRAATGLQTTGTWSATAEMRAPLPPGDGLAVHIRLTSDAPLKGARAYLIVQRARTLGEVVALMPDEESLRADRFGGEFSMRLRTNAAEAVIVASLRAAGYVERVDIRRDALPPGGPPDPGGGNDVPWAAGTLNAPLQRYVRMDVQRLDALMNLVGELVIARGRLTHAANRYADADLDTAATSVSRLVSELQQSVLSSRLVPVWHVFDRFPRVVRDAARGLGKEAEFVVEGREIELDRALLEQIGDPLVHLLRNAMDHGIEAPDVRARAGKPRRGRLTLSAERDRSAVVIRVTDDGRGIDRDGLLRRAQREGALDEDRTELSDDEVLRLISRPGFSTAEQVTDLSGRGVGMDAVVNRARALGGSVELHSELGKGTCITLRLPVTLAILPALLARVEAETYALPLTHVRETLRLTPEVVRQVRGRHVLVLRESVLPLVQLRSLVQLPVRDVEGSQVVVLQMAERRAGLVVDQLIGQQEVVVKPFDAVRGAVPCFSGATILSDGAPALILEAAGVL